MQVGTEHHDGGHHGGDRRVQPTVGEDGGNPEQHKVPAGTASDSRGDAKEDRRQPAESDRQGLLCTGHRPETDHGSVEHQEQPLPPLFADADCEGDQGADHGRGQIGGVGERDGRAVLEQGIADHTAAEPGNDADSQEAEEVQLPGACDNTTQQRAREHPARSR